MRNQFHLISDTATMNTSKFLLFVLHWITITKAQNALLQEISNSQCDIFLNGFETVDIQEINEKTERPVVTRDKKIEKIMELPDSSGPCVLFVGVAKNQAQARKLAEVELRNVANVTIIILTEVNVNLTAQKLSHKVVLLEKLATGNQLSNVTV